MPNLVGIGNTQTPTNSMLGGLAYQNPKNASLESVNIKHITKISQTLKPGTVIGGIFVYDTSRDSDGGAWRYRTQNTSWYNETLGTLLRGNRREFPAIAILVSLEGANNEHGGIGYCFDIYDGDDPECPLWMRFPIESYNTTANWGTQLTSLGRVTFQSYTTGPICALNGQIFIGNGYDGGTSGVGWMVNMISEKMIDVIRYGSAANQFYYLGSEISARADVPRQDDNARGSKYGAGDDHRSLFKSGISGKPLSGACEDVDMFVEQFTSIDDDTGLPFPSIALALRGGLSIVRGHDKGVDDDTFGSYGVYKVSFGHKGDLISINRNANVVQSYYSALGDAGMGGTKTGQVGDNNDNTAHYYHYNLSSNTNPTMGIVYSGYEDVRLVPNPYGEYADDLWLIPSSNKPLNFYLGSGRDHTNPNNMGTIVHMIAANTITGYMPGDCQMAVMGECANGPLSLYNGGTITEQLHYGNEFTSDTGFGHVSTAITNGYLFMADVTQARATRAASGFLVSGKKYYCQYKRTGSTNNFSFDDDGAGAGIGGVTTYHNSTFQAAGTYGFVFTATAANRIRIMRTQTGSGSNIEVQYVRFYDISDGNANVAQQHSLHHASTGSKNFGFAVIGTLKREPVAPGADLMCYSGWSNSNYLVRGADDLSGNTDYTDYGTNDYMWHFWVYPSGGSTSQALIGVGDASYNNGFKIGISNNSGGWYLQVGYLGVSNSFASTSNVYAPLNGLQWNCCTVWKVSNVFRLYINGQYYGSTFGASSINWSTKWGNGTGRPITVIGNRAGSIDSGSQEPANADTKISLVRHGRVPGYGAEGFDDEKIRMMYEDEKQLFRPNTQCSLGGSTSTPKAIDYDRSTDLLHVVTDTERDAYRRLVRINRVARTNSLSYPKISAEGGVVVEVVQ